MMNNEDVPPDVAIFTRPRVPREQYYVYNDNNDMTIAMCSQGNKLNVTLTRFAALARSVCIKILHSALVHVFILHALYRIPARFQDGCTLLICLSSVGYLVAYKH